MPDKWAAIINPASRSGKARFVRDSVVDLAMRERVEIYATERRGHAVEIARSLAEKGYERVVAVGGDGTLNEVANGLAFSDTALAVVPAGTGNDWVRTVGIPPDTTQAWRVAMDGPIRRTDLAEVEGHGFCLNVLGAGFDAEVVRRLAGARGLLAALGPTPRYVCSVIGTFAGYKPTSVQIVTDTGFDVCVPATLLVAVGVARYYGSGMKILPDAEIEDGLLDVGWGSGIGKLELPALLSSVFRGAHVSHPKVRIERCREIELSADMPTPFHIDGDVRGELPIRVKVRESALRIVVP
jgi:diacylglycerol kinase (ATP)